MTEEILAKKILTAYEKNLFYLPLIKLGHFFVRAYHVTGDKKYINLIAYYVKINRVAEIKLALEKLKTKSFKTNNPISISATVSERIKQRQLLYEKNPEINFFNTLFINLLFCKSFDLNKTVLKNEFKQILSILQTIDFKKIYLKEEVLRFDNSFSFNSISVLNYLGICDLRLTAVEIYKNYYLTNKLTLKKELSDSEFCSLIYGLTHIIIANSNFYEKFSKSKKNLWILRFFANNSDLIIQKVTVDILAEVALCFKLCRKEKSFHLEFKKIKKALKKEIHLNQLSNTEYLIRKEHTHSILMLLYWNFDKLFPGPNLSDHPVFKSTFLKNNH